MNDEEYREFLGFLFERYVRPRLPRMRRRFLHHMMEEWSHHLSRAERAAQILRFIELYVESDEDVYDTFAAGRLASVVDDTDSAVKFSNRLITEGGFLDACEAHWSQMLAGLEVYHLPEADLDVLREIGSPNPEVELRALIYRAKECSSGAGSERQAPLDQQLRRVEERLDAAREEFRTSRQTASSDSNAAGPRKSRRWFKGLGQISQGAALTTANGALALGALKFPVSPETQTWGVMASVCTGIGTILSGVGDLRNE